MRSRLGKGGYLAHYERHFEALADQPIVGTGASLLLWRDYFTRASIIGLDENPMVVPDQSGRIKVYQGKQEDLALLERIGAENAPGGFDVIIDDAAHVAESARASFTFLFDRFLKPGGIYAIEDWGTGYWPDWPDGKAFEPNHAHGMVGFLKELVDEVGARDRGLPESHAPRIVRLEILPGLAFAIRGRR